MRFPDPGPPRPRQEPRPAAERPFSYWENGNRENEPSFWSQGPQAEQELRAEREREPVAEEEAPAAPVRKKREPYLDNVKFVLIALVVTGHSLVPTLKAHSAEAAYLFIYMFHMPAFVLISGYLGRNFWNSNAKINKLVDTLLIPYVVVEIGYALLRFGLGQKWTLTIIDPAWLNWYLLALVLWRISTPIWTRMRQPLLVAVVIYMAAGFSEISGDFSIDRFFGLLPFYVLGLLLKPEHFDLLKPLWVKITSAVVLVGAAGVAIVVAPRVPLDPIYFRYSFKAMDMSWWLGFGVRGAVLIAALVMTVAVLALVPRGETWFSDLGTRTLYAYLLHGVVVVIAKDQGWLSFPWLYGPLGVAAIACSSLALAIVLCLPETRTLFKWMLEPRLVWLYRRPSPATGTAAATTPPAGAAPAAKESSASVTR
ncbi:acyltransferase family protein [Streptosporangium sp. NPDC048865]|uniref:acyltransferase family protein n=1 Tax=Streptosporangium sp. NPDC048865 TaxID=3155766 RepID=UPI003419437E